MGNEPERERIYIALDSRGRASIGPYTEGRRSYVLHREPGGIIVLTPAVVLTETELALAKNPKLTAQIEHALTHPETRTSVRRRRGAAAATADAMREGPFLDGQPTAADHLVSGQERLEAALREQQHEPRRVPFERDSPLEA